MLKSFVPSGEASTCATRHEYRLNLRLTARRHRITCSLRRAPIMPIDRLLSLASSYQQEGRLDLAESHYREAIGIEPDHWDACFGLGQVLIQQARFDEAIGRLSQMVNRSGDR